MVKLYQQLENLFKYRCNSNSEIIPYIKKLSEVGKFDEPKKVAVLAIVLDRLGKLEDEATLEQSVAEVNLDPIPEQQEELPLDNSQQEIVQEPETPIADVPATSPDAPQQPEQTQEVQTPVETPPDVTETPNSDTQNETVAQETPSTDTTTEENNNTVSEFSLDAVTDPQQEPPTTE